MEYGAFQIKLTKNEYLLKKIGLKNAKDTNKYCREFWDIFRDQPERLNPEGKTEYGASALLGWQDWMFPSDSPTTENK